MGGFPILAIVVLGVLVKFLAIAIPVAAVVWFVTHTSAGRNMIGLDRSSSGESLTLEITDQLRNMQVQLDDAHSRIEFLERMAMDQRDQLRALGAAQPPNELHDPTPV